MLVIQKIAVPLKYLSNFWRTLEIPLIHCEINLIWTWSESCVISSVTEKTKFAIAGKELYVPVVTLSTQDNPKLFEQLKSSFKRTVNWKKYKSKVSKERQNQYPPGNKTSWRDCHDVSLYIPATSQVRPKWNT